MAAMTQYLQDKLIRHVMTNTAYSSPATVYLALFTTATTDADGAQGLRHAARGTRLHIPSSL